MADLGTLAGEVAGAAASANPISLALSVGKDLINRFVPDPAAKAQAVAHLQDQQMTLALAQIDQQTKDAALASANIQNDKLSGPRSAFCYSVVALLIWNYAICRCFHQTPIDFPLSLIGAFTALMLGQAGIDMAHSVAAMPGESQVSVLGVKVGNKS